MTHKLFALPTADFNASGYVDFFRSGPRTWSAPSTRSVQDLGTLARVAGPAQWTKIDLVVAAAKRVRVDVVNGQLGLGPVDSAVITRVAVLSKHPPFDGARDLLAPPCLRRALGRWRVRQDAFLLEHGRNDVEYAASVTVAPVRNGMSSVSDLGGETFDRLHRHPFATYLSLIHVLTEEIHIRLEFSPVDSHSR